MPECKWAAGSAASRCGREGQTGLARISGWSQHPGSLEDPGRRLHHALATGSGKAGAECNMKLRGNLQCIPCGESHTCDSNLPEDFTSLVMNSTGLILQSAVSKPGQGKW